MRLAINGRFTGQPVTGVQRYGWEIVRALDGLLASSGGAVDVELLVPAVPFVQPISLENIKIKKVGSLSGHAWEQLDLPRYVGDRLLFCPGNTAPVASLMGRSGVVVCVHDLSYEYFPEAYSWKFKFFYKRLMPLIMRNAKSVITVSNCEKESIISRFPKAEKKISSIQNGGLSGDIVVPNRERGGGRQARILYVGSLSKRKNFPMMLEVAKSLALRRGFKFEFVGGMSGALASTDYGIAKNLSDFIEFKGQINESSSLIEIYKEADCFIFPSLYEASPLPPIEAMACGCPVVASSIPSLLERLAGAATYCNAESREDIESAIERVVDNQELREKLIEAGRARAREFTWRIAAQKTLDVLLSGAKS